MKPSSIKYKEFIEKYNNEHKYCPKCGCDKYSSTLFADVVYLDELNEYKDTNVCVCNNCKHKHITHDRISINKL